MSCPALISIYNTPRLVWHQTDLTVVIRIELIDVQEYYLRVEHDHLIFSTVLDDKKYYLILYLFGSVIAEKTVHRNVDREIKVYLTKTLKWFPWMRLTRSDEKNPLILYDTHHVIETESPWQKTAQDAGKCKKPDYRNMNIMPDVPSSDEEDFMNEEDDFFFYD